MTSVVRSFTAVPERNVVVTDGFVTEPYEVGWATEGIIFVHALSLAKDTKFELIPEVSPDGIHWCPHVASTINLESSGLVGLPISNFGNWLRLRFAATAGKGEAQVIVYFTLKG